MKVKIITYNMAMGKGDPKRKKRPMLKKEEAFKEFVKGFKNLYQSNPEALWLICVQEINRRDRKMADQIKGMKKSLEDETSVKWYKHDEDHRFLQKESIAVFSNRQCLGKNERIDLPGKRVAMLLEFQTDEGKKLGLVNTHFIAPGEDKKGKERKESMEKILEKISDRFNDANEPVIICGDLNVFDTTSPDIYNEPKDEDDATTVYEETIGKALEAGFYKFYNNYNPTRADITYHAWDNPDNLPSNESWGIFDYILVRPGNSEYESYKIINFPEESKYSEDSKYASDHKGALLTLDYSPEENSPTIEWGDEIQFPAESCGFDTDSTLAIALNNKNHVVEVHCDNNGKHYYMLGYLRFNDSSQAGKAYIEWNTADTDSRVYETGQGKRLAIALDDNDNVVEVHTDSDEDAHRYRVGKLALVNDENKISWKIDWQSADMHNYNTGKDLAVAIDNHLNIVEVHRGQSRQHDDELFAGTGKGKLCGDSLSGIDWTDTGDQYTKGRNPAVAMDDNYHVVEVHRGNKNTDGHFYRVGVLDSTKVKIDWKCANHFDDDNDEDVTGVAVAMDNNSNVVVVYTTEKTKDIWYAIGSLYSFNTDDYEILWNTGKKIGINAQCSKIALAMDNSHNVIVVYFKSDNSHIPYYRVGKLIKEEN